MNNIAKNIIFKSVMDGVEERIFWERKVTCVKPLVRLGNFLCMYFVNTVNTMLCIFLISFLKAFKGSFPVKTNF